MLALVLVIVVQMRAEPADLPAPDPAQLIHLPNGSARPLAQILELVRASEPLPVLAEDSAGAGAGARLFDLGDAALDAGRLDEAAALYLSIPEADPLYAHARRRLAWEVLCKGRRTPRRAVDLVHASLAAEPFDNDVWEDVVRVYLGALGADTSGWD